MNALVTYDYKPSIIDSIFIPIVNEILYFNKNVFRVFNSYIGTYETMNIALILFVSDIELQVKILKFGHWMKDYGCNICTKSSERHGRKFYFPNAEKRGSMRKSNTTLRVSKTNDMFDKSVLSYIPYFSLAKQCPNDTMHVLWCSGVFLKILTKCMEEIPKKEMDSTINGTTLSDEYGL